jgi:hypothetical protein
MKRGSGHPNRYATPMEKTVLSFYTETTTAGFPETNGGDNAEHPG